MADEPRFAKGDLNGVMAAHPHVADWVRDFEARYGARPMYYGELDRDAKKERPLNLIYLAKEPIFVPFHWLNVHCSITYHRCRDVNVLSMRPRTHVF